MERQGGNWAQTFEHFKPRNRYDKRNLSATGWRRLPPKSHGKEGVDGSSPSDCLSLVRTLPHGHHGATYPDVPWEQPSTQSPTTTPKTEEPGQAAPDEKPRAHRTLKEQRSVDSRCVSRFGPAGGTHRHGRVGT